MENNKNNIQNVIDSIFNIIWLCICIVGIGAILWFPLLCVPLAFIVLFLRWLYIREKREPLKSFWDKYKLFFLLCIFITWFRDGAACACLIVIAWWIIEFLVKIISK